MAVDGWVDAEAENVLVVLRQGARVNDVAVVAGFVRVDVDHADDAGRSRFDADAACLVEFVGEDVFVVCEGDDELDYEFAAACHDCAAGAPVGVFPADSIVLRPSD